MLAFAAVVTEILKVPGVIPAVIVKVLIVTFLNVLVPVNVCVDDNFANAEAAKPLSLPEFCEYVAVASSTVPGFVIVIELTVICPKVEGLLNVLRPVNVCVDDSFAKADAPNPLTVLALEANIALLTFTSFR
jgi:hypothetical protein